MWLFGKRKSIGTLSTQTWKQAGRRPLRCEPLEDRRMLSIGVYPKLPGLELINSVENQFAGQIFYLDFDGAENVTYNGPIVVEGFNVPAFEAPAELAGQEQQIITKVVTQLETIFIGTPITFTTTQPSDDSEYSVIHIGGDGSEFKGHGNFWGLAEQIDMYNHDRKDTAFVFSDLIFDGGSTDRLIEVTAHEIGHLLGYAHYDFNSPQSAANSFSNAPLIDVAHKIEEDEEVHQWITKEAYDFFASQFWGSELINYLTKPGLTPSSSWSSIATASMEDNDNNIIEGATDEDRVFRNPFGQSIPYLCHFVAGGDGTEILDGYSTGSLHYYSAYEQAANYWNTYVVDNYNTEKSLAYYYLGHVVHLLEDMSVPAHVHNDGHPLGDTYEDTIASNDNYMSWGYANGSLGGPEGDISLPSSLISLFQNTANYTEDYPSDDASGEGVSNSGRHQPAGITIPLDPGEFLVIADDLMPFAMEQVAALFRLFYSSVFCTDIYRVKSIR